MPMLRGFLVLVLFFILGESVRLLLALPVSGGVLGMVEKEKPAPLKGRGGFWAQAGALECHFGVDPDFQPAKKAHPAFVVGDIDALAKTLDTVGCVAHWDTALPEVTRFFTFDPVGNRVELIAQAAERA